MAFEFDAAKSATNKSNVMKRRRATSAGRSRTAAALDAMHDAGVDLSRHVDLAGAKRPGRDVQRVNVDFPVALLLEIDRQARRLGVTRQAFIKIRIADSLSRS